MRILLVLLLLTPNVWADNIKAPPPLRDENLEIRNYFREIYDNWAQIKVVTTNPNGNIRGIQGDILFYNNGGTFKLCVNTVTTTGGGTTWVCSGAYSTP